jgi:hypothetical protein
MIKKIGYQIGIFLRDIVEVPNVLIDTIDDSIQAFANKKMDTYFTESQTLAMLDNKYKDIETKRKIDGSEHIILFDEKIGLGLDEIDYQIELRSKLLPEPIFMPLYRFLANNPVHVTKNKMKYALQRLFRGWDDSSTWSLDEHLCRTLGAQLKHLAKTTHGWPQGDEFPEFTDWQKALNNNGDMLLKYSKELHNSDKESEGKIIKDAQKALRWVAKYLPNLWD